MSNTITNTATYTVVDIRKTFEGFSADLRMIASRTEKKTTQEVEDYLHDILSWAEYKYLISVDITLINLLDVPIKVSRYTIDEDGKANQSDRAGNNDWQNLPFTKLLILVRPKDSWYQLTDEQKKKFMNDNEFKLSWGITDIDDSYKHLSKERAQIYASNGYELKKENYK